MMQIGKVAYREVRHRSVMPASKSHSLMHIVHFLKGTVQWQCHSQFSVVCLFHSDATVFANALSDTERHILNLSNYDLSDTKSFLLSQGFNIGLPL